MMKQRAPTKAEAKYMNQCKDLGCIVCILMGYIKPYEVAPEHTAVHHIDGKTKQAAHFKSIRSFFKYLAWSNPMPLT